MAEGSGRSLHQRYFGHNQGYIIVLFTILRQNIFKVGGSDFQYKCGDFKVFGECGDFVKCQDSRHCKSFEFNLEQLEETTEEYTF